ncbi:MAG TPA: acyl-CoA dehydrogenase family protein [Candidatus Dormibacteraeota bacterium]|nr:acyl-CoA dehydrogenase family protein [Candidatus Dormibacteraeota bacterium]
MPPPDPLDFLAIDALLSDDERLIRAEVAKFVADRVLPYVAEWFEAGIFPRELAKELGTLGVLGMHLRGYDCAGASAVAYGLACLELEAGDTGVRSFVSVQGSLAMHAIARWGSEAQRVRWLAPMARGEVIGCFGLTEPDFGSNPAGMRTFARRDGGDWILRGTKMWISNGSIADVAIVWARSDDGIRGFLVPTDTMGFSARDVARKLSLRASVTSELVLDDCRLPEEAVLPEAVGMRAPLTTLDEARYGIIWGAMGAARACYATALEYAKTRIQFDRPIGGFQLIQERLVEMLIELEKGTLLALHLGRMKDAGRLLSPHVSFGKLNNVRAALQIARCARGVLGANGVTLEYPVIRHMNNLESVYTYEGTNEIHTLVLGEAITGLSAFT